MNFRLIYLAPYMLYNAAYIAVAYTLTERAYIFIFLRRDASRSAFLAKAAGLAAGSVFTAILLYFITALRSLRSTRSLPEAISAKSKSALVPDRAESASGSAVSSHHSDLSQLGLRRVPSNSFGGSAEFVHVENEEQLERSSELVARDRSSVPINLGGGSSARSSFFRMSSARLTASLSGGSSGEGRGFVRNASTSSMWDDMEQPAPKTRDEVFSMPACYNPGKPAEVLRLSEVARTDSANQIPRVFSRQTSGRFSRTSSASSVPPGPAPHLPSSAFTAPLMARNSSHHYSTDRKSWRGVGTRTAVPTRRSVLAGRSPIRNAMLSSIQSMGDSICLFSSSSSSPCDFAQHLDVCQCSCYAWVVRKQSGYDNRVAASEWTSTPLKPGHLFWLERFGPYEYPVFFTCRYCRGFPMNYREP
ncbi:hypothetical protein FGB62_13g127 [Gracilaria domingensis]|nr:hypothetical protein FGB62_13g127 [Gracilaria domingensis]